MTLGGAGGGLVVGSGGAAGGAGGATVRLPGFVNAHSHAFHRVLRGASETQAGDFWTWRQMMYAVAERLDPDSYRELATCVYAEMLLAGWTTVGEFHYLHHGPGGVPYADPNEMSWAIVEAAAAVGIRLTLVDACYLQAGVGGEALEGVQLRFSDGDGDTWSRRVTAASESGRFAPAGQGAGPPARLGAAIHSVRAVSRSAMGSVVAWAADEGAPLHVHVSEQRKENEDCLAATQMTPTDLLASVGAISDRTTAVHVTHLTARDVTRYGLARSGICACPTTERDLGDGVGPFSDLADSGAVLCVGSDSHAVIDPFEETRSLETHQRLIQERRGIMSIDSLVEAGSAGGARSLGWVEGPLDDWVTVRVDESPALAAGAAGVAVADEPPSADEALLARVLFGASPADVDSVTVAGRAVVEGGEHVTLGPRRAVADRLSKAITRLLDRP
ncbi:MAG: formimidoylglutamate deiminase [Acidimicrobiales bacterium]